MLEKTNSKQIVEKCQSWVGMQNLSTLPFSDRFPGNKTAPSWISRHVVWQFLAHNASLLLYFDLDYWICQICCVHSTGANCRSLSKPGSILLTPPRFGQCCVTFPELAILKRLFDDHHRYQGNFQLGALWQTNKGGKSNQRRN